MTPPTPEELLRLARKAWPDPTPEMLADPLFEAVWQAIKTWDISVPGVHDCPCGATGNHARAIFDALRAELAGAEERGRQLKRKRARRAKT